MHDLAPEAIRDWYVTVGDTRYPPEQVLAQVTGLARRQFSRRHARWVLQRAGLALERVPQSPRDARLTALAALSAAPDHLPAHLRPHQGRWVAVRDDEVLVAADTPQQVVTWLTDHRERGASIFSVPVTG